MPKKLAKPSGPEQVAEYLNNCEHPLKAVLTAFRNIILNAGPALTEHIKWNAPSFCFNGDDRITFNLHKTECIMLIFHRGAKVKDSKLKGQLFKDESGLLEWLADDRAVLKVYNVKDANQKSEALRQLVIRWIEATKE